jgi:hypothetical protein
VHAEPCDVWALCHCIGLSVQATGARRPGVTTVNGEFWGTATGTHYIHDNNAHGDGEEDGDVPVGSIVLINDSSVMPGGGGGAGAGAGAGGVGGGEGGSQEGTVVKAPKLVIPRGDTLDRLLLPAGYGFGLVRVSDKEGGCPHDA